MYTYPNTARDIDNLQHSSKSEIGLGNHRGRCLKRTCVHVRKWKISKYCRFGADTAIFRDKYVNTVTDNTGQMWPRFPWVRICTTCTISVVRNDKNEYILCFFKQELCDKCWISGKRARTYIILMWLHIWAFMSMYCTHCKVVVSPSCYKPQSVWTSEANWTEYIALYSQYATYRVNLSSDKWRAPWMTRKTDTRIQSLGNIS